MILQEYGGRFRSLPAGSLKNADPQQHATCMNVQDGAEDRKTMDSVTLDCKCDRAQRQLHSKGKESLEATSVGVGLTIPRPLPEPLPRDLLGVPLPLPILRLAPENQESHIFLSDRKDSLGIRTFDSNSCGHEAPGPPLRFSALEVELSHLKASMRRLEVQSRNLIEETPLKFPSGNDNFLNYLRYPKSNTHSGGLEGHFNVTLSRSVETSRIVALDNQPMLERQLTQIDAEIHNLERDQEELHTNLHSRRLLAIEGASLADSDCEGQAALRRGDELACLVHKKLKKIENERHAEVKEKANRFIEKLEDAREDFARGVLWRSDEDYLESLDRQKNKGAEVAQRDVGVQTLQAADTKDEAQHLHVATSTSSSLEQLQREEDIQSEPETPIRDTHQAFLADAYRQARSPTNYGTLHVYKSAPDHTYEEIDVDRFNGRKPRSRLGRFSRSLKKKLFCGCGGLRSN